MAAGPRSTREDLRRRIRIAWDLASVVAGFGVLAVILAPGYTLPVHASFTALSYHAVCRHRQQGAAPISPLRTNNRSFCGKPGDAHLDSPECCRRAARRLCAPDASLRMVRSLDGNDPALSAAVVASYIRHGSQHQSSPHPQRSQQSPDPMRRAGMIFAAPDEPAAERVRNRRLLL